MRSNAYCKFSSLVDIDFSTRPGCHQKGSELTCRDQNQTQQNECSEAMANDPEISSDSEVLHQD
jgi:hypothetical protein